MAKVKSKRIEEVIYDKYRQELVVRFSSGWAHRHYGVSEEEYNNLKKAKSMEEYYNKHIKGRYTFTVF